jgi:CRP-like cAMP-binding protein
MTADTLGKLYRNGEVIVQAGEIGNCMYVIQRGQAEVLLQDEDGEVCVAVLGEGDVFGEMALFDQEVRSATVRARDEVWALTLEKKTFLRRIHEDPSLVFNILEKMSRRIRELNDSLKKALGRGSTLR